MSMQLAISTNIEKELPQQILFNYEEIKANLAETLTRYEGMVVTESGIKDAKATRADLNRFKKALNDSRISIGKAWNAPYEQFKAKVDELIAMVDAPALAIDSQVKAFEDAQREERRSKIKTFYEQNIGNLKELLPLEKVFDDKWLNKGVAINTATNELHDKISKVHNDIRVIKAMQLECEDSMLDAYLKTLDMSAALEEKRQFETRQQALKQLGNAPKVNAIPVASFPTEVATTPSPIAEALKDIDVRFYATSAAFRAEMKALTIKHSIKYGGINNGSN